MRSAFLTFILLNAVILQAQEYRFGLYRVEQGLPSDIIKAITQDSLGFLWMATDDGLVKYDGLHFTTYKEALRSQYAKSFLHTRDGRLLLVGDLELIEINNQVDTVIFKTLFRGSRTLSDSTLWYPKSIYEDRSGAIWLDEPHSVIKFNGKSIKRFDFGIENRSPVFIRAFNFFEDDEGTLFVISFGGKVFRFNTINQEFEELSQRLPGNCSHVLFDKSKLWIATGTGLYQADVEHGEVIHIKQKLEVTNASHLVLGPDSVLWLSTFGNELFRIEQHESKLKVKTLNYTFNSINSSYVSKEGDIWAATDKGMVVIQKNLFVLADDFSQAKFIEAIAENKQTLALYYCNKETLVEIAQNSIGGLKRKILYVHHDEYFQSLQAGETALWASNTSSILLFKEGELTKRFDFSKEGDFVSDIFLDSHENLWAAQAGNPDVIMINKALELNHITVQDNQQHVINVVREGRKGMYAAASGIDRYLFFKDNNSKVFANISLPVTFKVEGDFNIYDLVVQKNDVVWLASTEGLLKYDHQKIVRVDLGDVFTNLSVGSIELLDDGNILFANSHGLFRYNTITKEFWLYDENSGLPSNTITSRGIFVDHEKRIWLGTSFGLARESEIIVHDKQTIHPYCVAAQVNGTPVRFTDGVDAPYGSFIYFQFSAITFPENRINLQWRLDELDSIWHNLESHQLSFTNLTSGVHQVSVRAKKNTGLGWSDPIQVVITIGKPYWRQPSFIFIIVILALVIAWASFGITSRILNKRRDYLQRLIDDRTKDLQLANDELIQRNAELDRFVYSASHDLSAPLKSVLGLITVSRMENPGDKQLEYLSMMERSVRKLEEFIRDVVTYSRNARIEVKYEAIDFNSLIKTLLNDHQYAPNFSKIVFDVKDETNSPFITDVMRLKIILNNLISNAIKFHRYDRGRDPFVKITLSAVHQFYVVAVEDNGKGIETSHLNRIFDMFYRATDTAQGSGLGLYILKETILKMNGTVSVQSEIDKGTTFTINFPIPTHLT